ATAQAASSTWAGSGGDNFLTNAGNWNKGVPASGDTPTFAPDGGGNTALNLNNTAQPINTLTFLGGAAGYVIGTPDTTPGDALSFDANGAISVGTGVTNSQTIAGAMILNGTGAINVNNASSNVVLNLAGSITGTGGITT